MIMTGNRLYKYEKLRSRTAINELFTKGGSVYAYPLRAVYRFVEPSNNQMTGQFLITIPKKKIRHAVDRVLLRRRVREAYRLNRSFLYPALAEHKVSVEIAFIYLSNDKKDYFSLEAKLQEILTKIGKTCSEHNASSES